jgi:D-glycero-D-manno-heptose 1,7-bisphosphate phosphatase
MSKAVFLDRDGTLVEEVPYLHEPERVALLPGVGTALRGLARAGFALVVVTNQAGVAHGIHDEAAVEATHLRLAALLEAEGVRLDGAWYCPHHPDGVVPAYARACQGRKPAPGMLLAAAAALGLDLARSWLVGNHPGDAAAARAAGVTPLFVTTGDGANRDAPPAVPVLDDLRAAATTILRPPSAPPPPDGSTRGGPTTAFGAATTEAATPWRSHSV